MRKAWKRFLSGFVSAAMLTGSVQATSFTLSDVTLADLESLKVAESLPLGVELLPAELPDELKEAYGSGAESGATASCYVIGNGQAEVDEHGQYALTIYRLGNTDKESSVSVKSIDYSALYGKDYVISDVRFETEVLGSEMSILEQSAQKENQKANAEAMKALLEMDGKPVDGDSQDAAVSSGGDRPAVSLDIVPLAGDVSGETDSGDTDEVTSSGAQDKETQEKKSSLAKLKQAQTGLPTRETIEDGEENETALLGLQSLIAQEGIINAGDHLEYSSITDIPFSAGETEKQLIFEVLDDKESEGEELIQFSIVDPAEGDLILEPNMATILIKDDEPKQRSRITFSDASYEANGNEARVKILREGAPYNMVTLSVSVKNLTMKNDYSVREIGFSPYVMENEIDLKFKLGDHPMDYEMELRDILGGDEGSIIKATLHVPAKSETFLDAGIGQDDKASSDSLDAVGHEAAEENSTITLQGPDGWKHSYNLQAYQDGSKPAGVYRIMSNSDDQVLDRHAPVQVGDYYAAESDYFKSVNLYRFGDSPYEGGSTKKYDEGEKCFFMQWYSRWNRDTGGFGLRFELPARPYASFLMDYAQDSDWESSRAQFISESRPNGINLCKTLYTWKKQNYDDGWKPIGEREFMGPIRVLEGTTSYWTYGNNIQAASIKDYGKVPYVQNRNMSFNAQVGRHQKYLVEPTMRMYGVVAMYKSVFFNLTTPSQMDYLKADGTTEKDYPCRINTTDTHKRFYGETMTFDLEQNDYDIRMPKGRIKAWEITPNGGQMFTVTREDATSGKISWLAKDCLTFTVNDDFIDELTRHGITVSEDEKTRTGGLNYEGYSLNVTVKPIFEYIPVAVKVMPPKGEGSFSSAALKEQKEYTFHVGDELDFSGTPKEGWYFSGYSLTAYKNYDDTYPQLEGRLYTNPLKVKLTNYERYEVYPVFTQYDNYIEIIPDENAKKYFDFPGLCTDEELEDALKGKSILKIDNPAQKDDAVSRPVIGDVYEIRALNSASNDGSWRPIFKIRKTGQIVNGSVADLIAGPMYEDNQIEVSAQKIRKNRFYYYEIKSRAVYSSAKLRNADGEKTIEPAPAIGVKVGGRSMEGYENGVKKQILFRTAVFTDTEGNFTLTGFEALPGDTVSIRFDNGDRQQVKYLKLPGYSTSGACNPQIKPSKRSFEILEPNSATKTMDVVKKENVDTYVVSPEQMGMPIISPRSPEVTKLTYSYDADPMRDTTKNMVEIRPDELIKVNVVVQEKETSIKGVRFILYDKNGNEKEEIKDGGGTQDGKPIKNKEKEDIIDFYQATFTADKGLKAGDTLYVQIVSNEHTTVTLPDGSKDEEYKAYPKLNSGLTFGNVIESATPQTYTMQPATGDWLKDVPFVSEIGEGLLADTGTLTFKKTYLDSKHPDTSPFYLTAGVAASLQSIKKKASALDEIRNGKHQDAQAQKEAKYNIPEKVAQMDPMEQATDTEKAALNNALAGAENAAQVDKIYNNWSGDVKSRITSELRTQQLPESIGKLNEKNSGKDSPNWDFKLIVELRLEFVFDMAENEYYLGGGQYCISGIFNYDRVWHYVIVKIPCYFAMKHEISLTFDGQFVTEKTRQHYDEIKKAENLEKRLPTQFPWITIGYIGKFMPGVGIYGVIGARGVITFAISVRFNPKIENREDDKGTIAENHGELLTIGGGVEVDLVGIKIKYTIAEAKMRFGMYDADMVRRAKAKDAEEKKNKGSQKNTAQAVGTDEGITETIQLLPYDLSGSETSYLGRPSAGTDELESAGLGLKAPDNIGEQDILVMDAAEYMRPQIVYGDGDQRLMTYLKKENGTSRIVYSVDTGSGFSKEQYVYPAQTGLDTTNDILFYDGKVYIAWTNAREQAEATGSEDGEVSVEEAKEALESMNLWLSVYNFGTGKMSAPIRVTNDNFLNDNVRLYAEKDHVVLYYYKKDLTGVKTAADLVSGSYNTWSMAEYDTLSKNMVVFNTEAGPTTEKYIQIDHPTITDSMVLDYSSAVYTTSSNRAWRMSLYTVDKDLNAGSKVAGTDSVDAEVWLTVKDLDKADYEKNIKLSEGNVTNARLNEVEDGVLVTWLKDARTLYTISAEDLFNEDGGGVSVFEHVENGDTYQEIGEDGGAGKVRKYEMPVSSRDFAEDDETIVNLSQYQVVSGSDGNNYLFTLAPGAVEWDEKTGKQTNNGQELWGASYYKGTVAPGGQPVDEEKERTGWGDLVQITHYGQVIDEMSLDVNNTHHAVILANMYENIVDEKGLTSQGYKLVKLECEPVTSLVFWDEPRFSDDNPYPMAGDSASIEFTLKNKGLLPARNYKVELFQEQNGVKTEACEPIIWNDEHDTVFTGKERFCTFSVNMPESLAGLTYSVEVTEMEPGDSARSYDTVKTELEVEETDALDLIETCTVSGMELLDIQGVLAEKCEAYGVDELNETQMTEVVSSLNPAQSDDFLLLMFLSQAEDLNDLMRMDMDQLGLDINKWYAVAYVTNEGNVSAKNVKATATQVMGDGTRGDVVGESKLINAISPGAMEAIIVPIDVQDGRIFNDLGIFNISFDVTIDGENWYRDVSMMVYTLENVGITRENGPEEIELSVGESVDLNMVAHPFGDRAELVFSSFNPDVASVDQNGTVTTLKAGDATICVWDNAARNMAPTKDIIIHVKRKTVVQSLSGNVLRYDSAENNDTVYFVKGGKYTVEEGLEVTPSVKGAASVNKKGKLNVKKDTDLTLKKGNQSKTVHAKVVNLKKKTLTLNSRRKTYTLADLFTGYEDILPDSDAGGDYQVSIVKDKKSITGKDGVIDFPNVLSPTASLSDFHFVSTGNSGSATISAVFGGKTFKVTVKCSGYPVFKEANGNVVQTLSNNELTFDSVENNDTVLLLKNGNYTLEKGVELSMVSTDKAYRNAIKVAENRKTGVQTLKLKKEAVVKLKKGSQEKVILINFINIKKKAVTVKGTGTVTLADLFDESYEILPDLTGNEKYRGYSVEIIDKNSILDIKDETFPKVQLGTMLTLKDFVIATKGTKGSATVQMTVGGKKIKATVKCKN